MPVYLAWTWSDTETMLAEAAQVRLSKLTR